MTICQLTRSNYRVEYFTAARIAAEGRTDECGDLWWPGWAYTYQHPDDMDGIWDTQWVGTYPGFSMCIDALDRYLYHSADQYDF